MISEREANKILVHVVQYIALLSLLALFVWKSKLEAGVLLPFLILGIISAIILCLIKKIKLSKAVIIFSSIISSLICSGLYVAFVYLFDRYIAKLGDMILVDTSLTVASTLYSIPGMIISLLAYPPVLAATTGVASLLKNGICNLEIKELFCELKFRLKSRQALKTPFILLLNLAFAAAAGTLLIWAVYSLPNDRIDENISSSAALLYEEGTYPSLYSWCFSRSDNFSDAIIMLEASDNNDASVLDNAMLNFRGSIEGYDPVQILKMHFLDGVKYDNEISYSRYWQGYLATVKPLLLFTDYRGIRIINGSVQLILIILICIMLVIRKRKDIIIPFLLCYLMLVPPVMGRCLFFSSCFLVTLASSLLMLIIRDDRKLPLLFLYAGITAAYVDLMSFPIMTFGIPAVIYLSLHETDTPETKLIQTVKNGLVWCLGFAGMWVLKWIIADILTDADVIRAALNMVAVRVSSSEAGSEVFSVYSVFGRNIIAFVFTPVTVLVIAYILYLFIKNIKYRSLFAASYAAMLPATLISFIPFFWYAFAANHSIIHYWFTCKSLVIPLFAMMCGLLDSLRASGKKTV